MNVSLNILIVEITLVLFAVVCILVFLMWKHKKKVAMEFDKLLNKVNDQQSERKIQLVKFLIDDHALEVGEAEEASEYMVEAEKQFMQLFIKQQIEQAPVDGFYGNLCELLDQYLYFVPKKDSDEETESSEDKDDMVVSEEVNEAEDNKAVEGSSQQQEEAEPDWGDAFSESGDEMDGDVKEGYDAEKK